MGVECILFEDRDAIDKVDLKYFSTSKVVLVPSKKETIDRVQFNQIVRFQFVNKYDKIFDGRIVDILENEIILSDIRNIGSILHNDVRVWVDIPATIYLENENEHFEYNIKERNISSGGMCFACNEDLNMETTYETVIEWTKTPIVVKIKLLRKEKDPVERTTVYGCRFVDLIREEEFLLRAGVYNIQAKKFRPNRGNVKDGFCEKLY